jgi:hypothetical protein
VCEQLKFLLYPIIYVITEALNLIATNKTVMFSNTPPPNDQRTDIPRSVYMPCNSIPCNSIPCNSIPCNSNSKNKNNNNNNNNNNNYHSFLYSTSPTYFSSPTTSSSHNRSSSDDVVHCNPQHYNEHLCVINTIDGIQQETPNEVQFQRERMKKEVGRQVRNIPYPFPPQSTVELEYLLKSNFFDKLFANPIISQSAWLIYDDVIDPSCNSNNNNKRDENENFTMMFERLTLDGKFVLLFYLMERPSLELQTHMMVTQRCWYDYIQRKRKPRQHCSSS